MTLSLRQLLFATMTLIVLIPIAIFAIWTSNSALENEISAVREKHLLIARNLTAALNRYAIDASAAFEAVSESSPDQANSPQTRKLLQQFNIHALGRYTEQGSQLQRFFGATSHFPASLKLSHSDTQFSDVRTEQQPAPTLFLSRQSSDGSTWLAAMGTQYIVEIQKAVTFGKLGHAAIVDSAGNLLAHPREKWQQQARNIASVSAVEKMMRGETGVTRFYSPAVEAEMIAGFASVESTGWGVMVPQPMAELYIHALKVRYVTIIVALIALAVSLATSWWLAGRLSHPVARLLDKTDQIARQQEYQALSTQGGLEVSELSRLQEAFDQMAKSVGESRSQLEQRVEERTAELRKAEKLSRHLAHHDMVTGLPNRLAVRQSLVTLLKLQTPFTLLFIDLDGFKKVNDQYGHAAGDKLLHSVARRIAAELKSTDIVARYGGDEFLVVMQDLIDEGRIRQIAGQIRQILGEPYQIGEEEVTISACIGIALSNPQIDIDQLIHLADTAMYQAKHSGKNAIRMLEPQSNLS